MFNTDQGVQFTSEAFTGVLRARGVAISMDGKGRGRDNVLVERLWRNVKYEEVYPHACDSPADLRAGPARYFRYCNQELKDLITERGYDVEEIARDLAPGSGRGRSTKGASRRSRYKYVDPNNSENTYVSGPFANWMKLQMAEKGMNPDSKEDRERFKETLKRVENT